MKVKNEEWLSFKARFMSMLEILGDESNRFDIPEETDDFELFVNDCEGFPVFVKKGDILRVEYDFTLCDTKIRQLSLSLYNESMRLEMTLKNEKKLDDEWLENRS